MGISETHVRDACGLREIVSATQAAGTRMQQPLRFRWDFCAHTNASPAHLSMLEA
ncbi:hypothetical protein XHC_1651 [Xanthomonas hortorum pv. carotae str. M081]|nr:hypothetical protein XHC_1651 [Xanthomonas hortorum pv. carotae str. M081]